MLWSEMPRPEESDSDDEGEMGGDEDGEGNNQFSADVEATGAREVSCVVTARIRRVLVIEDPFLFYDFVIELYARFNLLITISISSSFKCPNPNRIAQVFLS